MRRSHGFTLLEVLVALLLTGIIFAAFLQVFTGTLQQSSQVSAKSELLKEGQIALQVMASRLQEACYVYPPQSTLQLANSGYTTKNPIKGNYQWTVGTDPIVAMVLPPEVPGNTDNCDNNNTQFCYRFYAYYPILRSDYTSSADNDINIGADGGNDNQTWVLMQYLRYFTNGQTPTIAATGIPATCSNLVNNNITPTDLQGGVAALLTDYVQPSTTTPTYSLFTYPLIPSTATPSTTPSMVVNSFERNPGWNNTPSTSSATSVTLNLRMLRNMRGQTLRATGQDTNVGNPLSIEVSPRNLMVLQ